MADMYKLEITGGGVGLPASAFTPDYSYQQSIRGPRRTTVPFLLSKAQLCDQLLKLDTGAGYIAFMVRITVYYGAGQYATNWLSVPQAQGMFGC